MSNISNRLPVARWRRSLNLIKFSKDVLWIFGSLWLLAEIAAFFNSEAKTWIIEQWWLFFLVGLIAATFLSWPKDAFSCRLNGRDVVIEIRVGDVFKIPGSLIVSTNNFFSNDLGGRIPKASSIQGQFIREYYDGNVNHLDSDCNDQLSKEGYAYKEIDHGRLGKKREYEIGTVVQLDRKDRHFYVLALTNVNDEGLASSNEEDLRVALAKLWYYISEKGRKGDVVIPLIGTGHARIPTRRDEVVRTIIRSFVASCSSKNYCDKLVIALLPNDVTQYGIDVKELGSFLEHTCRYTEFNVVSQQSNSQNVNINIAPSKTE